MPNLFDAKNKASCCGCSACFAACPVGAISFKADNEGFLYPEINGEKCIECGKCVAVCPLKSDGKDSMETHSFFAVKHREKDTMLKSSSGGFFTAAAHWILENGGVVYGVIFDENIRAVHARADSKEALERMRLSKYVQSDLGDTFRQVKQDIQSGIPVLFTGTPCQVKGINGYLGREHENLYTMDLICHGVPSPLMFSEHIKLIEKRRRARVVNYKCRSKVNGWHNNTEEVFFASGKRESGTPLTQEHGNLFYGGYILRPSCYECKFTSLKRPSDITMADFWGIEKAMPDWDDQVGTSMILVNTQKGNQLFEQLKPTVILRKSETYGRQPQLERSVAKPCDRNVFWELYQKHGYGYIAAKYGGNSFKGNLKFLAKKVLKK